MSERTGTLSAPQLEELIEHYTTLANKAIARGDGGDAVAETYEKVAKDLRGIAAGLGLTHTEDPGPAPLPPGTVTWVASSTSEYHALIKPGGYKTLCGKVLRPSSLQYVSHMNNRAPSPQFKACGKCRILDRLTREDEVVVYGHQVRTARILHEAGLVTMRLAEGARLTQRFILSRVRVAA